MNTETNTPGQLPLRDGEQLIWQGRPGQLSAPKTKRIAATAAGLLLGIVWLAAQILTPGNLPDWVPGNIHAFLITSPLVNEIALALFLGTFGVKVTLIYALSGILLGVIGGAFLNLFKLERLLTPWIRGLMEHSGQETEQWEKNRTSFHKRLPAIAREARHIVSSVILYVIIGIAIGAGVHGYVPTGFFEESMSAAHWWSVPAAVLCAVPMYANAAAIVPVIEVFVAKGIPLGTALAFMIATVGLSLPEAAMLRKVMTWRLCGIFFGTVTLFIILSGYLFNLIL